MKGKFVLYDKVSITLETYRATVAATSHGEPHVTLTEGTRWLSPEEQASAERHALDELHEVGLAANGALEAGFRETLAVLQRPGIEYYTFADINGRGVTIRTAAVDDEAVLAIGVGETVHLTPIEPDRLAHELVWILPDAPPADLGPVSCAEADLRELADGRPARDEQSALIAQWLDLERHDGGELHVATQTGRRGRRARTSMGCAWLDTSAGRLLSRRSGGRLHLRGARQDDLIATLHDMAGDLGEAA